MTDAVELKKVVKQLQGASSTEDITNILRRLKREFQVNETILRESKAGLAVGKLRTHAVREISDLAKELVKKWKNEVEKAKRTPDGHQHQTQNHALNARKLSTPQTPTSTNPSSNSNKSSRTAKTDGVSAKTGDTTRDKCTDLIYDALVADPECGHPADLVLQRAKAVESAVYKQSGDSNSAAYKAKLRSLFVNLKDIKNPGLRESVLSGDLPAEKFATMDPKDMASEERKAADRKIEQDNLHNSLGAEEQQAETDAFQCGRCKQRKCRYRQAQTRSADEPMTTFVTCTNCGNRWKFS